MNLDKISMKESKVTVGEEKSHSVWGLPDLADLSIARVQQRHFIILLSDK